FAFMYGTVDHLGQPFFAGNVQATIAKCLYYSFTTLTTVGYGDLTAATNLGHTLSVSEALFGQIYLVTVVSVIVGNLSRARRGRRAAASGLVSLGATSAVVNAVVKLVGRRRRPDRAAAEVPRARQVRMPGSRSFPSGHTAAAVAFASGVGRVMPVAALPLHA